MLAILGSVPCEANQEGQIAAEQPPTTCSRKSHGATLRTPLRRGFSFAPDRALICSRAILLYAISTMIEIVIERWTNAEGQTDFRWSVWSDGYRIQMGQSPHSTAEDC